MRTPTGKENRRQSFAAHCFIFHLITRKYVSVPAERTSTAAGSRGRDRHNPTNPVSRGGPAGATGPGQEPTSNRKETLPVRLIVACGSIPRVDRHRQTHQRRRVAVELVTGPQPDLYPTGARSIRDLTNFHPGY